MTNVLTKSQLVQEHIKEREETNEKIESLIKLIDNAVKGVECETD